MSVLPLLAITTERSLPAQSDKDQPSCFLFCIKLNIPTPIKCSIHHTIFKCFIKSCFKKTFNLKLFTVYADSPISTHLYISKLLYICKVDGLLFYSSFQLLQNSNLACRRITFISLFKLITPTPGNPILCPRTK